MPMKDRAEHLAWAKQRALEYLDAGDIANAVTSMDNDAAAVRRWIEGFR
jgi:hypothetical protein